LRAGDRGAKRDSNVFGLPGNSIFSLAICAVRRMHTSFVDISKSTDRFRIYETRDFLDYFLHTDYSHTHRNIKQNSAKS
jgi:hypothetical protein